MVSIHEDERSTESNGFRKLLLQTDTQIIEDSLFTKLITQKRKKMKMKIKEERKLLINNQKHIEKK